MTQFIVTNFLYAPDIADEKIWDFVVNIKGKRDYPWLFTEKHNILLSGIGQNWRGWRKQDYVISHAGFKATPFSFINAILTWLTHFWDALQMSRREILVILAPTPVSAMGAAIAKAIRRKRIRLVVRIQGHTASRALYVKNSKWQYKVIKLIERFALRQADLVIPMGKFTYNLAISQGVKPEKIIILAFPVRWIDQAEITELPESPTVLFVGRLEKEKGVHLVIQAMTEVKEKVPAARLLIAGEGSYRPTLEKLVDSIGLRDTVFFLGWLDAHGLQNVYRESSVLVMPSIIEEGLGMVLVEAGLMGRPVVASDIGGIKDIVRHGENGLLVPPGDISALAEAIVTILTDRNLASRMGLAGAKIAREYLKGRDEALEHVRQAIYGLIKDEGK